MPSRTITHALVGGLVSVLLSFTAVSPFLGGTVAGYLERRNGLRVGALAGVVAAIPLAVVFLLFAGFVLGVAGAPAEMGVVLVGFLLFAVVYTVVLSAAGGWVGVWLFEEYGDELPV